jgi:acylphosphatase
MSTNSEPTKRLSARIRGRVQGVGFRHFTTTRARELGLTGWVRNEPDGSVRVEAEGNDEALQSLLNAVKDGPRAARVDAVDTEWDASTESFDTFGVRYA